MEGLQTYGPLRVVALIRGPTRLEVASTLWCHRRHSRTSDLDRRLLEDLADLLRLKLDAQRHRPRPARYREIVDR